LVSSSLGLCGAFNINVCKFLLTSLKPTDRVMIIGRKGYSYLKSHGLESQIIGRLDFSDTNLDYLSLLPACESAIEQFSNGEFSSVHLVYTKFINSLTFNPITIQLLPFDSTLFKQSTDKPTYVDLSNDKKQIDYEPSKEDIIKSALSIFFTTSLFAAIAESRVCENGARRNAMETATDNAKELIDDLTLEFNDARQQNITQEINEIVAGADGSAA
jgi:F-type H+-transporting ATPase subunit gamma